MLGLNRRKREFTYSRYSARHFHSCTFASNEIVDFIWTLMQIIEGAGVEELTKQGMLSGSDPKTSSSLASSRRCNPASSRPSRHSSSAPIDTLNHLSDFANKLLA